MPKEIILLFTGFRNNMAFHAKTVNMTHNLEVLGSSPSWSTLKIRHLRVSRKCFFFYWRPSSDLFETKVTLCNLLKRRVIFCEFKKCFRKLKTKTTKSIVPIFVCRQIEKCCRTPPYYINNVLAHKTLIELQNS